MKKLLLLGALALMVSACTNDPAEGPGKGDSEVAPSKEVLKHLPVDQSRIISRQATDAYAATRAVEAVDAEHAIEAEPDITDIPEYDQNGIWGSVEAMVIKPTTEGYEFQAGNLKRLYVAKPGVKISYYDRNNASEAGTLYILSSATDVELSDSWDQSVTLKRHWTYYVWGSISDSKNVNIPAGNVNFYYYGTKPLNLSVWQNAPNGDDKPSHVEIHADATFKGDVQFTYGEYWFGGKTVFENNFSTDNKYPYFWFSQPAEFKGQLYARYGEYRFDSSVTIEDLEVDNGMTDNPTRFYFNDCAILYKFVVHGNNKDALEIYVNYFLELTQGVEFQNGSNGIYRLNNGVLVIDGESAKNNAGKNVFVNGHFVVAEGNSAVYIQGSITGVQPSESEKVFKYFRTKTANDKLAVFGKRTRTETGELVTAEPVIYLGWASNESSYTNQGYNTVFDRGRNDNDDYGYSITVKADPTTFDGDFEIGSNDENDCRANYTWGEQPPSQDEILPPAAHKYSATSLAFDGNYVYICWHSNLPGGESQDGFEHDHGTNMDPDREDEAGYGGPSVEDSDDWGGIIDIVQINNYHPDRADLYIAGTVWNPEHKYNHVQYFDGKLYLASTSWNVGAALHVVPLAASDTGVGQTFDTKQAYRVNLTGNSANCVEIIDNKYIVTISGRTEGGLNWFAVDDESSQVKKYRNSRTAGYGGKFIYDDGKLVYALHDTTNATVTAYNYSGVQVGELSTGVSLVPYDGKNAMVVKDGKVYICCGRNGLHVFDWNTGERVGRSKVSANCVDVDDEGYIYVATGGGLAVFKNDSQDEQTKEYHTVSYVAYTGKGFVYPNGWEKDGTMPDGTAKESSNFVRVRGDKVFVAYGMYGMRIYSVSELIKK